jgi:HPr kinase/phosphorylase
LAGRPGVKKTSHLHASAVVIGEAGVLILGPSGCGKSALAYRLVAAAEEAGYFARLVGDDRIGISAHGNRLIARGHAAILGKIERRGRGIVEVPFLSAAVLRLAVRITGPEEMIPRYPEQEQAHVTVAGIDLPCLALRQDAAQADLAFAVMADLRSRRLIPRALSVEP